MMMLASVSKYLSGSFALRGDVNRLKDAVNLVQNGLVPLICIDVEAWERQLLKVTEVGIAIYDPALGPSLFPAIETTHLIVKEHLNMVNGRFVPDKKHQFNGAKLYIISQREMAEFVRNLLLRFPRYAFVGHNFSGDVDWLRSLGINVPLDVPVIDVADIWQLLRNAGGTLHGVLEFLDIPHYNLHNAANDAYYTLLAALVITDPKVRLKKGLDTYTEIKGLSKSQKRRQTFQKTTPTEQVTLGAALYHRLLTPPSTTTSLTNNN